jgi:hypothetical protein
MRPICVLNPVLRVLHVLLFDHQLPKAVTIKRRRIATTAEPTAPALAANLIASKRNRNFV